MSYEDTVAPRVVNTSFTSIDGLYKKDAQLILRIDFSEVVDVAGTPRVLQTS